MSSDEEWIRYYHQQHSNISSGGLSQDATTSAEKITSSPTSFNNSSPLSKGGSGNCISKKPIRRRSRASKKTPTTRLNATATNFRALVQKFTGCTTTTTAATILSFGPQRGSVNLNFAESKNDGSVYDTSSAYTTNPAMAPRGGGGGGGGFCSSFGYDSNCNYFQMTAPHHQCPPNHPQMVMLDQDHQQQQSLFSMFDQDRPSDLSAYNCGNSTPSIHTLDDFLGLENISMYELVGDA